jgi:hypothetical protein
VLLGEIAGNLFAGCSMEALHVRASYDEGEKETALAR